MDRLKLYFILNKIFNEYILLKSPKHNYPSGGYHPPQNNQRHKPYTPSKDRILREDGMGLIPPKKNEKT